MIEFSSFTELMDNVFYHGRKKIKQYPLPIELNDAAKLINETKSSLEKINSGRGELEEQ